MRADARRLRPCRPAPESLEALVPVSSLAIDVPAPRPLAVGRVGSEPATVAVAAPRPEAVPARVATPLSDSSPTNAGAPPIALTSGRPSTLVDPIAFALTAAPTGLRADGAPNQADMFASSILLTSNLGTVAPSGSAAAGAASMVAPAPNVPGATHSSGGSAPSKLLDQADGIRPMTLAAVTAQAAPSSWAPAHRGPAFSPTDSTKSISGDGVGISVSPASTSQSGGSGPPTLVISGSHAYGRPQGGTGTIPWVMQGQMWEGMPVLTGQAAANYSSTPKSYTWSFPQGALKGYGAFQEFAERSTGNDQGLYDKFMGSPVSEDSGLYPLMIEARVYDSTDDIEYRGPALETNDHVFNYFYFGPTMTGAVRVSVTATFPSTVQGVPDFTGTTYVDVNVARPTGLISLDPSQNPPTGFGTAGVTPYQAGGSQLLRLGGITDNNGTTAPLGIAWTAYVDPTATGIGTVPGSFAVTQIMKYQAHRKYLNNNVLYTQTDGLVQPNNQNPDWILDSWHYPSAAVGQPDQVPVGVDANGDPNILVSNDTPGMTLPPGVTINGNNYFVSSYDRSDEFRTVLMYLPPSPSVWVPVGQLEWDWTGAAYQLEQLGTYKFFASDTDQNVYSYSPTTTFPTWTYTFKYFDNDSWVQTSP